MSEPELTTFETQLLDEATRTRQAAERIFTLLAVALFLTVVGAIIWFEQLRNGS